MATATPLDTDGARDSTPTGLERRTCDFYCDAMLRLRRAGIRFLVGGAYALRAYTGIERHTRDFDIFLRPADVPAALDALTAAGYQIEIPAGYWLAKAYSGEAVVDLICSSGNGIVTVDDVWFEHAPPAEVFGMQTQLVPPEELIWSKSFIMERERYDGADIAHVLLTCAERLDWARLIERFGPHWRVLLNYLVLFGFIYPGQRDRIPRLVMEQLIARLQDELAAPPPSERIGQGTLLSRQQYLIDVVEWGFEDARLAHGYMTAEQIEGFTVGIEKDGQPADLEALARIERKLHTALREQEAKQEAKQAAKHEATLEGPEEHEGHEGQRHASW